jgi:hypothetical protein
MEQQTYRINSTFDKMSLIHNIKVQFSVNERRVIEFRFPTVKETLGDLQFKVFLGIIILTPEEIKKRNLKFNFKIEKTGDLIQGLVVSKDYYKNVVPYLLKYITNSEYKETGIYVDNEKVMSYELDYIVQKILIAAGQSTFKEETKEEEDLENTNPMMAKILKAQKESEEKLKKKKEKKSEGKLTIEEIMLAVTYEFGISQKDLLDLNYFSIIWYFGYVGKVDAHKLNQMILSSGMSKQKSYSYWLNK